MSPTHPHSLKHECLKWGGGIQRKENKKKKNKRGKKKKRRSVKGGAKETFKKKEGMTFFWGVCSFGRKGSKRMEVEDSRGRQEVKKKKRRRKWGK